MYNHHFLQFFYLNSLPKTCNVGLFLLLWSHSLILFYDNYRVTSCFLMIILIHFNISATILLLFPVWKLHQAENKHALYCIIETAWLKSCRMKAKIGIAMWNAWNTIQLPDRDKILAPSTKGNSVQITNLTATLPFKLMAALFTFPHLGHVLILSPLSHSRKFRVPGAWYLPSFHADFVLDFFDENLQSQTFR